MFLRVCSGCRWTSRTGVCVCVCLWGFPSAPSVAACRVEVRFLSVCVTACPAWVSRCGGRVWAPGRVSDPCTSSPCRSSVTSELYRRSPADRVLHVNSFPAKHGILHYYWDGCCVPNRILSVLNSINMSQIIVCCQIFADGLLLQIKIQSMHTLNAGLSNPAPGELQSYRFHLRHQSSTTS